MMQDTVIDAEAVLRDAKSVLLIDWPSRDVPEGLARAGYTVIGAGGPEPDSHSEYTLEGDEVVARRIGLAPDAIDLVYAHRPVDELPRIVAVAKKRGARAVWLQSGLSSDGAKDPKGFWLPEDQSAKAREVVEAAGLIYMDSPYIADLARDLHIQ